MLTAERLRELLSYDPEIGSFTWNIRTSNRIKVGAIVNNRDTHGYVNARIDRQLYRVHRLAFLYMTGQFPSHDIDHANGDRADNRWCNLRPATRQENLRNKSKTPGRSGIVGVERCGGKWRARLTISKQRVFLGSFDSANEAKSAYEQGVRNYFGEFARI